MTARFIFNIILNNPEYGKDTDWIEKVLGFIFGIDQISDRIETTIKQHIDIPTAISRDSLKCIDCVLPICSRKSTTDNIQDLRTSFVYMVQVEVIGCREAYSFIINVMYNTTTTRSLYMAIMIDYDSDILDVDLDGDNSEQEMFDIIRQDYNERINEVASEIIDCIKKKIDEIEIFRRRATNMKMISEDEK